MELVSFDVNVNAVTFKAERLNSELYSVEITTANVQIFIDIYIDIDAYFCIHAYIHTNNLNMDYVFFSKGDSETAYVSVVIPDEVNCTFGMYLSFVGIFKITKSGMRKLNK